jgi:hypothetical protein
VQVATIFGSFFREWTSNRSRGKLSALVVEINDTLESMGFKGKFAAFTLGILNINTGEITLANAGDNQLHIADGELKRVKQVTMPEGPAAGVFPSSMLPNGFPEIKVVLKSGDVLLFFTDGVEESKRRLRASDYSIHQVTTEDHARKEVPESIPVGVDEEELGIGRIHEVVAAVQNRSRYRLHKLLDPFENELVFDFSDLDCTAENLVMALIAVEKVFRLVPNPTAGKQSRVMIDRVIDDFLKTHFRQYGDFFHHPVELGADEKVGTYRIYSFLQEDEQYDDLTILAIRKK